MKNFLRFILILALLLNITPNVFAINDVKVEPGAVLGLDDCISIALNNSTAVKNARSNYNISRSNVNIARSEFFPTIGVGTGWRADRTETNRYKTTNDNYVFEASLNQLLWNFGRTNAHIKMQKFYQIADEYNFYNTVREITFNVKERYYDVLAARATVFINKAYVEINERNYQRTKAYFDEGIKSKIDLVNAEVALSDAKIQLIQSEGAYKNALVKLNNEMSLLDAPSYSIVGTEQFNLQDNVAPVDLSQISKKETVKLPKEITDATLITSVEKLEVLSDYKVEEFPYSFEECMKIAYKNRADLKAYNSTLDAVKQNLVYVKRNYYPELSANAGYGFRDTNNTSSFNVGINLSSSVNIMNQKARVDAAKSQVDIAQNSLDQVTLNIYHEVQAAYIAMIEFEKQIPLIGIKVKQTLENYELAEGRYYVGLGDYIQLEDAKENYNNAQNSYIETIYKYQVARAALESVIALPQKVTVTLEGK